MSKYGVFSVPYFRVFSPTVGKYGPEKTLYLDNLYAVLLAGVVYDFAVVTLLSLSVNL